MSKLISLLVFIIFIAASFFVIVLPSILSTPWGKEMLLEKINSKIPGKLHVQSLDFNWGGPQKIAGIELFDTENKPVLSMQELEIETSFFNILTKKDLILNSNLKNLNASIEPNPQYISNLHLALGSQANDKLPPLPFPIKISQGEIILSKGSDLEVHFSGNLAFQGLTVKLNAYMEKSSLALNFKSDKAGALEGEILAKLDTTRSLAKNLNSLHISKDSNFEIVGSLKNFPTSLLALFAQLNKKQTNQITALLGEKIFADFNLIQHEGMGPTHLFIKGQNGVLSAKGRVEKELFVLDEPLKASFLVNEQLAREVFADGGSIVKELISTEKPIIAELAPQGFSYSLKHKHPFPVTIGSLKIDLGKTVFSTAGQLGKIIQALDKNAETIPIWFTPIYLSLNDGIINIQRFDMLIINEYPAAAWGIVDIPSDKIKMFIGLKGKSLQKITGLPFSTTDQMVQFPLEGKLKKVKLDKSKLAGKLAALTAQIAEGPHGLIGTFLGIASGSKEEITPPPTTTPFPWESETNQTKDKSKDQHKEVAREIKESLKEIKANTSKLLQNLLK